MKTSIFRKLRLAYRFRKYFWTWYNRTYFKIHGVKFGEGVRIFNHCYFSLNGNLTIGNHFVMTSGNCLNSISSNFKGAININGGGILTIGDHVGMSSTSIWCSKQITIGDRVLVGANVLIIDDDAHPVNYKQRFPKYYGIDRNDCVVSTSPIVIEDDVWIGAHCIILKGVRIGARSIIGAGSVVTRDIPADSIAAGNPCKVIKHINIDENSSTADMSQPTRKNA